MSEVEEEEEQQLRARKRRRKKRRGGYAYRHTLHSRHGPIIFLKHGYLWKGKKMDCCCWGIFRPSYRIVMMPGIAFSNSKWYANAKSKKKERKDSNVHALRFPAKAVAYFLEIHYSNARVCELCAREIPSLRFIFYEMLRWKRLLLLLLFLFLCLITLLFKTVIKLFYNVSILRIGNLGSVR